jgi:hypothetical protein
MSMVAAPGKATAKRSGRSVITAPTRSPPFDAPTSAHLSRLV